jgi:hypothetical protein
MNPNCVERRDSTVAPQALHLMNNGMVQLLAEHFARRVAAEAGADPAKRVEMVYMIALSRSPSDEEKRLALDTLAKLTAQWTKQQTAKPDEAGLKALATFCHAVVNSAGFLYVD